MLAPRPSRPALLRGRQTIESSASDLPFFGSARRPLADGLTVFLSESCAGQEVDDVEVVLVTGVLEHLLGGIDLVPGNERRPRPRPRRRIGNGELVVDG